MSKVICASAIEGAVEWIARAEARLDEAIDAHGEDGPVELPDTAYFLPVIYSFTGIPARTLADLRGVLQQAKELVPERPSEQVWLPYLGGALDAGVASLFACEIIEACNYVSGPDPREGIWLGAANDIIMRERGVEFVDGTAPGFAAITGAAPTNRIAVDIARQLQEKNMYVFMAGGTDGRHFAEQLHEEGVQLGWETRLVPFGREVSALIYALGFASRAALSFGGVAPGDFAANLRYNKDRIFAFVLSLGEVTADKYAVAAGAINYGFPVIADTDIPQILPTGVCTYEHVVASVQHQDMVDKALEVRGCKIQITEVPIPVSYGVAFEGERIRKEDTWAEFGGNRSTAFEFVTTVGLDDIDDGEIEIHGPDIDALEEDSTTLPLAIWVEVAGRKMQTEFEPILERQVHHLLNGAEGIWHMGQRDSVWTRVSKNAYEKGLRLRHYGEILHARLLTEYPAIVDKVKVTLITEVDEVERRVEAARRVYDERNRRLEAMTDESVDTFYSCLLCQSFAPDHVCIITPERLGLCGAYNWLDGRAAYEIDDTGPNQPVRKGECLDPVKGAWTGVDEYVQVSSHKTVDHFCMYSIMDHPMTSCGCFEVICAYLPECNGVMVVNREYEGETPVGMRFSTLAGSVGGGHQTPGFMGIGKVYLTSRKFLAAEGGHQRLVWMPQMLKQQLAEDLQPLFAENGTPDLLDRIADERVGTDADNVRAYLEKVRHPALELDDMESFTAAADTPGAAVHGASAAAGSANAKIQPQRQSTQTGHATTQTGTPERPVSHREPVTDAAADKSNGRPGGQGNGHGASAATIEELKQQIATEVAQQVRATVTREIVADIIDTLSNKFLGTNAGATTAAATPDDGETNQANAGGNAARTDAGDTGSEEAGTTAASAPATSTATPSTEPADLTTDGPATNDDKGPAEGPSATERLAALTSIDLPREACEQPLWTARIGATVAEGGTRSHSVQVGGATCMPFELWKGRIPHRPLVAMEVFDTVSRKYPESLRQVYGDLLHEPAEMARVCVEQHGADLISVRLEGTHPEKGNRSPQQAVELVQDVLRAVDVPLIVTGHNHYERNNDVLKAVAQAAEGERLLLNWVEQENYRTIAGAALAYGHTLVAQSPIDVNIAKQLNILITNMDVKPDQIIMDPMTGAMGYGLEYSYSVMERIRLTGLNGDAMLAGPMIVSPGQECARAKELRAPEEEFPAWGPLGSRAALWELCTATSLLYAGADILIMYHPEAAVRTRQTIAGLLQEAAAREES